MSNKFPIGSKVKYIGTNSWITRSAKRGGIVIDASSYYDSHGELQPINFITIHWKSVAYGLIQEGSFHEIPIKDIELDVPPEPFSGEYEFYV